MKKLLYLITLVALMGISANTFAQGTGVAPQIGEEHTYQVDGSTLGSTFAWTLTTDVEGKIPSSVANFNIATGNLIKLTWINPDVNLTYYLHVVEMNAGCSNRKVLAIKAVNAFTLDIVSLDASEDPLDAVYSVCAEPVKVTSYVGGVPDGTLATAQAFKYAYGVKEFYYKITAQGINFANTTWKPVVKLANSTTTASVTAAWDVTFGGTTNELLTGDNIIPVPVNVSVIYVKVTVDNGDAEEGTDPFTETVTLLATSADGNDNVAAITGDAIHTQTISARPATTLISTTE